MSNYQIGVEVDVYLNDLTYQIASRAPQKEVKEFILLLDAEISHLDFTMDLVKELVVVLNDDYGMNMRLVDNTEDEV